MHPIFERALAPWAPPKVADLCTEPRTMGELERAGYTRDQVYGAVKRGELVNLKPRRVPGLFQVPETAAPYDAGELVRAWR